MSKRELILLALQDSGTLSLLERALRASNFDVAKASNPLILEQILMESSPVLLVVSEVLENKPGLEISTQVLERFPTLPILLFADADRPELFKKALRIGLKDVLVPPIQVDEIVKAITSSRQRANAMGDWVRREVRRTTASLEKRATEMETLARLGQSIHGSLDINDVFGNVVSSAVELTNAEQGHLLLVDSDSKSLMMRAARSNQEKETKIFNLPIQDELAEQVISQKEAISYSADSMNSLKANPTVFALVYVPIFSHDEIVGVLGVSNSETKRPFTPHNEVLMKVLADYAGNAIRNARLFQESEQERAKLDTTLTNVQDGIILLNLSDEIMFINPVARRAFGLGFKDLVGIAVSEVISNQQFMQQLESIRANPLKHHEINFDDGRVFNMQYTPIPDIGAVVAIEDITHLKMLDRLKSDFIHTISHDLRSPLTAIMGYVELLDRVGPLNDQQKTFVKHVQNSVNNITALVNDLLDLGRIEAGFDQHKDVVSLPVVLQHTLDNLQQQVTDKALTLESTIAENIPDLSGNPIRIRQVVDNLIVNAIKYTPVGGKVAVNLSVEENQIVFVVSDTGVGIPSADLSFIFDKFYRASNAPKGVQGTGLGLAIVKSIVENHGGRIWVESTEGKGTKFSIVFPPSVSED